MTFTPSLPALLPTPDPLAVAFFAEHGGLSYFPDRETPEEGRDRNARGFARAEAAAKAQGLTILWTDDWEVDHEREFPDAYPMHEGGPTTCERAEISHEGETFGSLGCIDDASDEYKRVVEAELAYDALPASLRCDCVTPDLRTCGTCDSSWCAKCAPSPADRCHYEAEHEDDEDDDPDGGIVRYLLVELTIPDRGDPERVAIDAAATARGALLRGVGVSEAQVAQVYPGDIVAEEDAAEAAEDEVGDAERIAYATRRIRGWIENLAVNTARADDLGRVEEARQMRIRSGDFADIVKMLDGTDDAYIASLRP